MSSCIVLDGGAAVAAANMRIKSIVYTVDHAARRVHLLSDHDRPVRVHVFGQHDTAAEFETYKHHYPGVASDVKFTRLRRHSYVNVMLFDAEKRPYLRRMRIQDRLYYTHHHYGKYYVYGQVPAVMQKTNATGFVSQLYVSAPIFDDAGALVSVISDFYIDSDNNCVLPISGDAGGVQGRFCLDGFVYITDPDKCLRGIAMQTVARIDVYVAFDKKHVYVNLMYNGQVLSKIRIRTLFAANVLIL
ncbi:p26 [Peridroma alphabaculovirus]|uniref:p26 n=1 Tax=Peridroma alphabaculovirus TaxID=1346829 RepID=A0A068LKS8_9ABAC|nr:p26 [Peridroma alphabaculovirus]AIE47793.1 p26 [Peridroma alphabaculovirus]